MQRRFRDEAQCRGGLGGIEASVRALLGADEVRGMQHADEVRGMRHAACHGFKQISVLRKRVSLKKGSASAG